jgi:hypothetical protein
MPSPVSQTFDSAVILILKHRLANPAIVVKHSLAVDKASIGVELETATRLRLGMTAEGIPEPPAPGANPKRSSCCGN